MVTFENTVDDKSLISLGITIPNFIRDYLHAFKRNWSWKSLGNGE